MNHVDLNKIIETKNLDKADIAKQLFPENLYPMKALTRILDGKANLDTVQLSRLAAITGLTFEELYGKTKWKSKADNQNIIFEQEDYRAELNTKTWVTKVFHKGSLLHEEILNKSSIPLSEYLEELNKIINK